MNHLNFKTLSLIVLSLFIVSCQKGQIYKTGYLSSFNIQSRSIASVGSEQNIDAKQILIYCEMTSKNLQDCFYKSAKTYKLNTSKHSFHKTKKELATVAGLYINSINPKFEKTVNDRVKFCNKNSLYNFKRCLKLNSIKLTMKILNEEHKNARFNAQEYLYLKKKILNTLNKKYEQKILARLSK